MHVTKKKKKTFPIQFSHEILDYKFSINYICLITNQYCPHSFQDDVHSGSTTAWRKTIDLFENKLRYICNENNSYFLTFYHEFFFRINKEEWRIQLKKMSIYETESMSSSNTSTYFLIASIN